jgi:DNA polymerase III gamma/tau subunit
MEMYRRLRPTTFKGVVGQDEAVKALQSMIDTDSIPHTIMLCGPSGTGKTTIARILVERLGCDMDQDFIELDAATKRGIDDARQIRETAKLAPWGKCRVWLIDECHKLTGDAQTALLKTTEDSSEKAYFILATTDPNKVIPTLRGRCQIFSLKAISAKPMEKILLSACKAEKKKVSQDVLDKIVDVSAGSARVAMQILERVLHLDDEDEQLNAVIASDANAAAIEIARALIKPRARFSDVAKVVKACEEDPEGIRRLVLAYCTTILLGAGKLAPRAAEIIDCFQDNYFDSGKAGLALSCWKACGG